MSATFLVADLAPAILSTWEWIGLIGMLSGVGVWMALAYARLTSMDIRLSEMCDDLRQFRDERNQVRAVLGEHERRISVAETQIEHFNPKVAS